MYTFRLYNRSLSPAEVYKITSMIFGDIRISRQLLQLPGVPLPTIDYGTALSETQLNATVLVPGNFVYTPAAGTVLSAGTHTLHVDFTPTDTANYTNATADVTMNVSES